MDIGKIFNTIVAVIICIEILVIISLNIKIKGSNENKTNGVLETQHEENRYASKVNEDEFIENLKAYLKGEKIASVRLSNNKDGQETEMNLATGCLEVKESDISIDNNLIKITVAEDMIFEWKYIINNDNIEISINKDNPTSIEKIVIGLSATNMCHAFVAYAESLGANPDEAFSYWNLAFRDINSTTINGGKQCSNDIFSSKEEMVDNKYSLKVKINNKEMAKLSDLLEKEKMKKSDTTFVGYGSEKTKEEVNNVIDKMQNLDDKLSNQAVESFNMLFKAYEGNNKSPAETKSLISVIKSNNITSDKVVTINFKGTKYEKDNILNLSQLITAGNKYNIIMSYDSEGYVNAVTIN